MLVLQLVLFCLLFALLVKCLARESGRNCMYFYSSEYLDEAVKRGIVKDKDALMKKGKRLMIPFCLVMLVALLLIVGVWNRVTDFGTAYFQVVIFLIVMNWFDGICIDRIWVGHSKLWKIEGMEGVPYLKPWKTVLIKRGLGTVLYFVIALPVAWAVVGIAGVL